MVNVKGKDASARGVPNSACTVGNTTTTVHMPMLPIVPINSTMDRRNHE
jgi:hypothetical protein